MLSPSCEGYGYCCYFVTENLYAFGDFCIDSLTFVWINMLMVHFLGGKRQRGTAIGNDLLMFSLCKEPC